MKKERKVWTITLIVLWWLAPSKTNAQQQDSTRTLDEVVVTGTRFDLPIEKSGKFILRLNEQQLREQSGRSFSDLLNSLAGIQLDGNFGTPGSNLSYYVRGARNRQTLVVVDGVPMNDPSGIDAFYDLRYVATDQVRSVEVLQGGLSTLYGSGAAASVINVQLKEPEKGGVHGSVHLNGGSWNSFGRDIGLNAREGKFSFLLFSNQFATDGFSSALDKSGTANFDKDGFERRNEFIKVGYAANSRVTLDFFGGRDWFDAKYDAGPFKDAANSQVQMQTRFGLKGNYRYAKGSLQWVAQQLANTREFKSSFPSVYEGNNLFAEIIHTQQLGSTAKLLSGVSFQQLNFEQKNANKADTTQFTIVDPYTSLFVDFASGFQVHAGVRLNTHSVYGSNLLYNVNPSWTGDLSENSKLKVFASISSSFITPSLYQLYSPYGNKKLKPEEYINYEYGVSFMHRALVVNAVNFYRDEANTIGFVSRYENLSTTRRVSGVTIDAVYLINQLVSVRADYTFQSTDAQKTFYRIPQEKLGASVTLYPSQGLSMTVNYLHTGNRMDLYYDESFNANEIALRAYDLVNIHLAKEWQEKKWMIYGLVNNLMDEQFVGVYGFTTQGRNFTIGARYRF
ncbi:MAG: TonB-dependent receptor plug domain-containing protein [Cyclobacteriaceae bacterium]|jgi:vitamin B12 transporter